MKVFCAETKGVLPADYLVNFDAEGAEGARKGSFRAFGSLTIQG